MPWSIKEEMSNVPPEGDYHMRIEAIEAGLAKSSGEPKLNFKTVIVGGDEDGTKQFYSRSLQPNALMFLSRDLANAAVFELDSEEANEMPDEPSAIASVLSDHMVGKVYAFELTHGSYNGQKTANWKLTGPKSSF